MLKNSLACLYIHRRRLTYIYPTGTLRMFSDPQNKEVCLFVHSHFIRTIDVIRKGSIKIILSLWLDTIHAPPFWMFTNHITWSISAICIEDGRQRRQRCKIIYITVFIEFIYVLKNKLNGFYRCVLRVKFSVNLMNEMLRIWIST